MVDPKRTRILSEHSLQAGPGVYWMSRDQRVNDNWALLYAQQLAISQSAPLAVAFCLAPHFMGAGSRQYNFMLAGLKEVERRLARLDIAFCLLYGDPDVEIPQFLEEYGAGALVSDFSPLRISRGWKNDIAARIAIPFYEVDAHNVIPCWHASVKQEWAAYTFRPKIHRLLGGFLVDFPAIKREMNCPPDIPILEWLETVPAERKPPLMKILESAEEKAAEESLPNVGAEECLLTLRDKGVLLGIITRNSLPSVRVALERFVPLQRHW